MPDAASYTLGHSIRVARDARGLTQRELASLLDVKQSSVAQWESSKTKPSRKVMPLLARHLGLPLGLMLEVSDGSGAALHPDAVELAVRASYLDDRTRRALMSMVDSWIAGGDGQAPAV